MAELKEGEGNSYGKRVGPELRCQLVGTKALGREFWFCLSGDEVDLRSVKMGDGYY